MTRSRLRNHRLGLLTAGCAFAALVCIVFAAGEAAQRSDGSSSAAANQELGRSNDQASGPLDITYRKVLPDQWPPAEAADLREISLAQWDAWMGELNARQLPPATLDSWTWEARFSPEENALSGEFLLSVLRRDGIEEALLLPLGEFSAAIISEQSVFGGRPIQWQADESGVREPAIIGNRPDGELALLVDREGTATFTAAQRASEQTESEYRFEMRLPAAPRRALRLELPSGWQPRVDGIGVIAGVEELQPTDSSAHPTSLWNILLTGDADISLVVSKTDTSPAPALRSQSIVREQTVYRADADELLVTSQWKITIPPHSPKTLRLQTPAELDMLTLSAGNTPIEWRETSTENMPGGASRNRILEFDVPSAWGASTVTLEAIAMRSLIDGEDAPLPRMVLRDVFWQSGIATVRVMPPLRFVDLQVRDARQVAGLIQNEIQVQLFSPLAEISLAVGRRPQKLTARQLTRLAIQDNQLHAKCLVRLHQELGKCSQFEFALSPAWEVQDVALLRGEEPTSTDVGWKLREGPAGQTLLVAQFPEPVVGRSDFSLLVTARGNLQGETDLALPAAIPIHPSDAIVETQSLLLAQAPHGGKLELIDVPDLEDVPSGIADDASFDEASAGRLLSKAVTDKGYQIGSSPSMGWLRWRARQQGAVPAINVHFELTDTEARETFHFDGLPSADEATLFVYISESRDGEEWKWTDDAGNTLDARKLTADEQAARSLPTSGELWSITVLEDDNSGRSLLGVRTTHAATLPLKIALATTLSTTPSDIARQDNIAPQDNIARRDSIAPQDGVVSVTLPQDAFVSLAEAESTGGAHAATIMPLWPETAGWPSNGSQRAMRYAYESAALLTNQPASILTVQTKSALTARIDNSIASDAALNRPLIWQQTLHWTLDRTGVSSCRVVCNIDVRQAKSLALALPLTADLVDVRTRRQSLSWTKTDSQYVIQLPASQLSQLELRYVVTGDPPGIASEIAVPWPAFETTVLRRTAQLQVPAGIGLTHGNDDETSSATMLLARRLLGPLIPYSELKVATIEQTPLSSDALNLLATFIADAQSALTIGQDQSEPEATAGRNRTRQSVLASIAEQWQDSGNQLFVDFVAMAKAGILPGKAVQVESSAMTSGAEQVGRWLRSQQLVLCVANDHTLVVTTREALLTSGLTFATEEDSLYFELRAAGSKYAGDDLPESSLLSSLTPPDKWTAHVGTQPSSFTADELAAAPAGDQKIYKLSGGAEFATIVEERQQLTLNAFGLAMAAILGWVTQRKQSRYLIAIGIALAVVSLSVTPRWAVLVAGLPLAFAVGAAAGWIVGRVHNFKTAGRASVHRLARAVGFGSGAVCLAFVLWGVAGTAGRTSAANTDFAAQRQVPNLAQTLAAQNQNRSHVVFMPVDDTGQATGESLFVSDELIAEITNRIDEANMRPRGYLLTSAEHRIETNESFLFSNVTLSHMLSLRVISFAQEVNVRLPLQSDEFRNPPQSAFVLPLGRESSVRWSSNEAELTLQGTGKHVIDFRLSPKEPTANEGRGVSVRIPRVAKSSLEISHPGQNDGARRVELTGDYTLTREIPLASVTIAELGPANKLQLDSGGALADLAQPHQLDALTWLRVSSAGTRVLSRITVNSESQPPQTIVLLVPLALQVESVSLDGRLAPTAVVSNAVVSESASAAGPTVRELEITLPDSQLKRHQIDLEFSYQDRRTVGQWSFPRIAVKGLPFQAEIWAIDSDESIQVSEMSRQQAAEVSVSQFAQSWGANVSDGLFVRPLGSDARWRFATRASDAKASSTLSTQISIGRDGCSYRTQSTIEFGSGQVFCWRALIPDALKVTDVKATDNAGRDILGDWAVHRGVLVVFTSAPVADVLRIQVDAVESWPTPPKTYRPVSIRFEKVEEVSNRLTIFSRGGTDVSMTEPAPHSPASAAADGATPAGTRLVGSFSIVPGGNSPRLSLKERALEIQARLITRIFKLDGRWHAGISLEGEVLGGQLDAMSLDVTHSWRIIHTATADVQAIPTNSEPDEKQRIQLLSKQPWNGERSAAAFGWELQFRLPDQLEVPFDLPTVTLPGGSSANVERLLVVPKTFAGEVFDWDVSGDNDISTAPGTIRHADSTSVYRFAGETAQASGRLSIQELHPRIPLVVAATGGDDWRGVAASYLLQPGGLSSVVFQLPETTQLVAVDIDGLPAQYRILADGNCEVFLYSTSQPQQIGICLIDEPVRGDDGAAPVSREIALPIEIPVAETLWLASGPAALASESLSSLRLNAREADTRQLEALKTKLHSFESSSPLAQQALASELRKSVALAQGWAASAQGEGAFNDAAPGALFELARLRANAELILGDAWRQPIETERVESSASSATGIASSFSPGGGFLFSGLQAELTVPSGESPGSTWPRWIMAIFLLTTGILQLVYTSRRTQPADKNPGT